MKILNSKKYNVVNGGNIQPLCYSEIESVNGGVITPQHIREITYLMCAATCFMVVTGVVLSKVPIIAVGGLAAGGIVLFVGPAAMGGAALATAAATLGLGMSTTGYLALADKKSEKK